jgi:hypothetical protein
VARKGEEKKMKNTMIAIAFAVASVPMIFAAQAPATPDTPPASGAATKEAPKAKKHVKKNVKKAAPKTGSTAAAPVSK